MILTKVVSASTPILRFKAPKGKMYSITNVHGEILSTGNNAWSLLDRAVEEPADQLIVTLTEQDSLFYVIKAGVQHSHSVNFDVPVRTKYISLGRETATSAVASITIVYELVNVTKFDLLWEWFSKRS